MLGNDKLRQAANVVATGVFARLGVVFRAVNKAHNVGVLLDGTRLTEVGELRTLAVGAVFNATVKLRQRNHRNGKLLGKLLERARNGAHLLLTAAKLHSAGIHKLQIVDDNHLYVVLAHKAASLRTQFKHRERRSVVDIERSRIELLYAPHELVPLQARELSALDFLTLNLTHVADKAVHELKVRHLKREHGNGYIVVHRHILSHREHERGLTHGRTRSNDDEVAWLPARSHLVEVVEACFESAKSALAVRCVLNLLDCLADYGVDLRHVLLHIVLRNLEELTLSLLKQVVNVVRLVERFLEHSRAEADKLAGKILLRHNAGVIFHIGSRRHAPRKL